LILFVGISFQLKRRNAFGIAGSLAQFVGKRTVEKDASRESPKAGLSHSAWKSRKSRAISTFPTASAATTNHFPLST
jgi:hypothetical protein